MQRMSGIATKTNHLNGLLKGTKAKLLDTRKTTPNLRYLEKKSVLIGGGQNHRMGLYDMIMLKDNHIDFAGGIKPAILKAQQYIQEQKLKIPIEVETRNINELQEVLNTGGVQRVMFDNYTIEQTKEGVKLVNGLMETESSGGITEDTIRGYAETGVDFISVGALTHSVKSLDLSLKAF
jgi:nicotinate-nucleotide pyrophosphorylase (carboxylating)